MPMSTHLRPALAHAVCVAGLAVVVPAIAVALAPAPAEARAGGSYGSTSGSSGSSSGSSSGTYRNPHSTLNRMIRNKPISGGRNGGRYAVIGPVVSLVVITVLLGLLSTRDPRARRREHEATEETPGKRLWQRSLAELLPAIAERDPAWQEAHLLDQAREAFMAVQLAWARRDQSLAREYVADEIHDRHKALTDAMLKRGERNVIEGLEIVTAQIVHAADHLDDAKDEVWVKFKARATKYLLDECTGQVFNGSRDGVSVFTEVWKFRRHDATWLLVDIVRDGNSRVPRSFSEAVA